MSSINLLVDAMRATSISNRWGYVGNPAATSLGVQIEGDDDLLTSSLTYSLAESSFTIKVNPLIGSGVAPNDFHVMLFVSTGNYVEFHLSAELLIMRLNVAGVVTETSIQYAQTQQLWWRIREERGMLYWETSPEGKFWTVVRQALRAENLDVSSIIVKLGNPYSHAASIVLTGSAYSLRPYGVGPYSLL